MTKLLEGKTVLVTGASAGIGRAAAIGAARHGADVAINFSRDVAGAGLYLDNIRAAIAEVHAGNGRRDTLAELDDPEAVQRPSTHRATLREQRSIMILRPPRRWPREP